MSSLPVANAKPAPSILQVIREVALRKQLAGDIYRAMRRQARPTAEPSDAEVDSAIQDALQAVRKRYA